MSILVVYPPGGPPSPTHGSQAQTSARTRWDFHRVIAATAGAVNLLLGLFVLREGPAGFLAILALVMLALAASGRLWRQTTRITVWTAVVLTGALAGYFLFGFPAHLQGAALRLPQVAVVLYAGAVVLATILVKLRLLRPAGALMTAFSLATVVLLIETIGAVAFSASEPEIPLRSEWLAIRRGAERRNRPGPDPGRAPPGRTATPSASSLDAGSTDWTDERAPRPAWSAVIERDSALGISFRPLTLATTFYHDNPRHYFEAIDFRREIWQLGVAPGSTAHLEFPATEPDQFRVSISEAKRGVPPWHINVSQANLRISGRASYLLEFRVRADRPRNAIVAVTEADAPYALDGLIDTLHLTPVWQHIRLIFTAERSDSNARIHFALGGDPASVDVADLNLRLTASGRPVLPPGVVEPWGVRYRFDGLGCRGPERPAPDSRRDYRILLLGGAFTMGVGVHETDTFAAQLDTLLNAGPSGAVDRQAVINCGVPGYGMRESRLLYQRVDGTYQPQLVVFEMNPEDDRTEWEKAIRPTLEQPLSRPASLFQVWSDIRTQWQMRRTYDYGAMLEELVKLKGDAAAAGARLVVLLAPSSRSEHWNLLRRVATPVLARIGVPLIDLGDTLVAAGSATDLTVHLTDAHPNEKVHALLARLLVGPVLAAERSTVPGERRRTP